MPGRMKTVVRKELSTTKVVWRLLKKLKTRAGT
jgi:hypothetical protein